jgi:predicted amidohydrolase
VLIEEGPGGAGTFRVAAIHFSAEDAHVDGRADGQKLLERNFERTAPLIRMAARAGARIVLTPEYCNIGSLLGSWELPDVAVRLPAAPTAGPLWNEDTAPVLKRYARLAAETGAYVVTNVIEGYGDRHYNALVALAPDGRLVARYRKRSRWLGESVVLDEGDEAVSFDTPYGRFGMLICFDVLRPKTWCELAFAHDVDFILCPTLWPQAPLTPRFAMNLMANATGRPVIWSNQRRMALAGGAGLIRPWDADTTMGMFGPRGTIVANVPLGEHRTTVPAAPPTR